MVTADNAGRTLSFTLWSSSRFLEEFCDILILIRLRLGLICKFLPVFHWGTVFFKHVRSLRSDSACLGSVLQSAADIICFCWGFFNIWCRPEMQEWDYKQMEWWYMMNLCWRAVMEKVLDGGCWLQEQLRSLCMNVFDKQLSLQHANC